MKIAIVAGEASGDLLGANLIKQLHTLFPKLDVFGLGGPQMIAAGCHSIAQMERLSVMGLLEPLLHLRDLFKLRRELLSYFLSHKPDVFIGIDSPDFNLSLELKLRRTGIPIIHYVSPSVWAWRQKRVHRIKQAVDLVLTLFPFEANFYQKYTIPACFVGHPLADIVPMRPDLPWARTQLNLDLDITYVALFPGSRRNEIKQLAEVFVQTAQGLLRKKPKIKFITSAVNPSQSQMFQEICKKIAPNLPIHFFIDKSHEVMAASDIILLKSGTITLEAMLCKRPMVIAHRLDTFTYQIARHMVKAPFIGLPNLLANEALVPEFIQNAVQPEGLCTALINILEQPEKTRKLIIKFTKIHQQLKCNANQKAAAAIKEILNNKL